MRALALACVLAAAVVAPAQMRNVTPADTQAPGGRTAELVTQQIGIDQRLGESVPMDLPFTDENGRTRPLGDFFRGKPVLMMPIFYDCKGTCTLVFDAVMKTLIAMKADSVGGQYDVVTFSIDPKETPAMAAERKKLCLEIYAAPNPRDGLQKAGKDTAEADRLRKQNAEQGWHFLVGSEESVSKLTGALGFRYTINQTTGQINHPAGIMILTPEGKISQYFYGVEYAAPLVMNSIRRAGAREVGFQAEERLFGCLAYDPATGTYKIVIERVIKILAGLTLVVVVASITIMGRRHRTIDPSSLPPASRPS